MKKKLFGILLISILLFGITGCSNSVEEKDKMANNQISTGTWKLNARIFTSNEKYNTLASIFGSCIENSKRQLVLNEDNTFSLDLGCYYVMTGNYTYRDNKLTFSNITDENITNADSIKDIEKNLFLELIIYNDKEFLKMNLYDFEEADIYIYFEKDPELETDGIALDPIPDQNEFTTTEATTNTNSNGILLSGVYEDAKGKYGKFVINNDNSFTHSGYHCSNCSGTYEFIREDFSNEYEGSFHGYIVKFYSSDFSNGFRLFYVQDGNNKKFYEYGSDMIYVKK